jgi:hypothetical protein
VDEAPATSLPPVKHFRSKRIFSDFGGFFDKKWDRTSIEIAGISSKTGQRQP